MRRLNGWHRLWVTLSVIWLVLVVTIVVIEWPSEASAWRVFLNSYIQAVKIEDTKYKGKSTLEIMNNYNKSSDRQIVLSLEKEFSGRLPFDRIALDNLRKIDAIPRKQKEIITIASLSWFVPVLIVYLFGWAVAWVRQGFKNRNE